MTQNDKNKKKKNNKEKPFNNVLRIIVIVNVSHQNRV